jgi:hypothetical protein
MRPIEGLYKQTLTSFLRKSPIDDRSSSDGLGPSLSTPLDLKSTNEAQVGRIIPYKDSITEALTRFESELFSVGRGSGNENT